MAKTKSERWGDIHTTAMAQFRASYDACSDVRKQCIEDRRFATIAGAQWDGPFGAQFENKPKLEVNKVHLSVMRLINEYRNNRITVDFMAKDGEEDDLADICDGLYRADEEDSVADEAYDNAFEEAVTGGIGAWRLRAEYEDDEDEDDDRQRIRIEPIYDADTSVFFDVNAKRQDKSDAGHCFVLSSTTREAFVDEWGVDAATFPKDNLVEGTFAWDGPDFVYVAEYYVEEETGATVGFFTHLDNSEEKLSDMDDEDAIADLEARGAKLSRTKKIKRKKVRKYILCGGCVLKDCGHIAGPNLPVIPTYGKRWFVDNIERCQGHVRLAKDAQRLKNMQLSKLAELSAFGGMETPIFTPEQVQGHEASWTTRNTANPSYLLVNALTDKDGNEVVSGPAGYTQSPMVPQTTAALLQIIEEDMQDVLGNQDAGEEVPQGVSGKAIELIQNRLDMQSFIYMSNMAKAVRRCGEIWLGMARELYVDEGRKMKAVGSQGQIDPVVLMEKTLDNKTGEVISANDLTGAKFDVVVDVGPSSASKRAATVKALTGMMGITQDPETLQVLSSMAMMNMEGEGIGDVRDWFRQKLVRMGVVKPTDQEQEDMAKEQQNAQPNAQDQFLLAKAEEAQISAMKTAADADLSVAKTEKTQAETQETLAGIDTSQRAAALQAAKDLRELNSPVKDGTPPSR